MHTQAAYKYNNNNIYTSAAVFKCVRITTSSTYQHHKAVYDISHIQ